MMQDNKKTLQVVSATSEGSYPRYVFGQEYPSVKIENGIWINNAHINTLVDVKIDSPISNVSTVTLVFLARVEGLDVPNK